MHLLCGLHFKTQANVPFGSNMFPRNCHANHSRRNRVRRGPQAMSTDPKKARLIAKKQQRLSLSNAIHQFDASYPFRDFLNHPMGIEAMLNTRALQSFEQIGPNIYRCSLHKIQLLNFEVTPVLDLCVTPTNEDCIVEMTSCKFEGSEIWEQQNKQFSASLRNHIKWEENCTEPFLDVDVEVAVLLEVHTMPFVLLPISAVETPGNLIMQALVDRLVPLLLQQLLQDYKSWVETQSLVT